MLIKKRITNAILTLALITSAFSPCVLADQNTLNNNTLVDDGYNLYFGQLHSHTTYSDGIGTVRDAFNYAKNTAKVDFLAVTDHSNSFDNQGDASVGMNNDSSISAHWIDGHKAADEVTDSKFVGIYGYEMTWSNGLGHINTYNTPGFESRENTLFKGSDALAQYYSKLKNCSTAIAQFNHPGTTYGDFNDFSNYDPIIDKKITLLEVGNGEGAVGSNGYFRSYSYYNTALDKGWHVAPTNNQDNHKGHWGDANTCRDVVLAKQLDRASIYDAIQNRRVYATEDNNLSIHYTLNNQVMGTIINQKQASANIAVQIQDQNDTGLSNVSVIVDGGQVAAEKNVSSSNALVNFTLPADYKYYYIKVVQPDGDIAVTAPVWIEDGAKPSAGIDQTTLSTSLAQKGQPLTVTTTLFNNSNSPMNIQNIQYYENNDVTHTVYSSNSLGTISPLSTSICSFQYTPSKSGTTTLNISMTGSIDNVVKTYTSSVQLKVADPANVTKIVIDASHYNDYVSGYYNGNMTNLIQIASDNGIQAITNTSPITDATLKDCKLLLLSPPARKSSSKNGVSYTAAPYSQSELDAIKRYTDAGGNVVVTNIADYQDGTTPAVNHGAYQQNLVLSTIGATSRINDDEVLDYENNSNASTTVANGTYGTPYRIPMNAYNTTSAYTQGVDPAQNYSFYSGSSITVGSNAAWIVKGTPTTYACDSDNDGLGGTYCKNVTSTMASAAGGIGKGNVIALASETLTGGGKAFIAGTVFYSNFEIKTQLDNASQLQNSNYNIVVNILNSIKKVVPVSTITSVRQSTVGDVYAVEGTVTAGTQTGNSFFDTIYVQDATGGINIYPVSGMDIKPGQKVRVTGNLDSYMGDLELRVTDIKVIDSSVNPVAPQTVSTLEAMKPQNGGKLLATKGVVTKMNVVDGVVSEIFLKDDADTSSNGARIFIDGYVGYSNPNSSQLGNIKLGDTISASGIGSYDTNGPRLRVRDRSEINFVSSSDKTISLSSANAVIGRKTILKINANNMKDLAGVQYVVYYPADKLSINPSDIYINTQFVNSIDVTTLGQIKVAMVTTNSVSNNCELAKLSFKINQNSSAGDINGFNISVVKAIDSSLKDMLPGFTNGKIKALKAGDVKGNNAVDAEDALIILKSINGKSIDSSYYMEASDVNGDGNVMVDDCIMLLKNNI